MSEATESGAGKARKRQAGKASKPQAASKVKATIHLSVEASQRLSIHATMLGLDRSELVERLVMEGCRRFVVSDRGGVDGAGAEVA